LEVMMVQWTVTMARNVPADLLARVSSYDIIGSVSAMPLGALLAGPIAAAVGGSATQYGAAALIVVASALTMPVPEVPDLRAAPDAGAQGAAGGGGAGDGGGAGGGARRGAGGTGRGEGGVAVGTLTSGPIVRPRRGRK